MRIQTILTRIAANVIALAALVTVHAQTAPTPYPKMAPIEQYLMDRDAEIALARTAAPHAIARDAAVLVLTRHGYQTAVTGKSGWTCMVDRGWSGMLDHPEFWSPRVRAAACLNPAASRSFLPYDRLRTSLVLAGKSKEEIVAATATALQNKQLPPSLEPGAMCYMMSKTAYLTDQGDHAMSHVMFYTPDNGAPWGAHLPTSPRPRGRAGAHPRRQLLVT
jgi:hypothetical protein